MNTKTLQAQDVAADPLIGTDVWTTSISVQGKPAVYPCSITAVGDWKLRRDGTPWRSLNVFVPGFNAGGNIVVDADTVFVDAECTRPVDVGSPPPRQSWSAVVNGAPVEPVKAPPTAEEVLAALAELGRDGSVGEATAIAGRIDFATLPVSVDRTLGIRTAVDDLLCGVQRKNPVVGINGKTFTHIFDPATTGQDGFYQRRARGILFYGNDKDPFAFAVANPSQGYFFVSCSAQAEGIRYMYGASESDSKRLGLEGLSSSQEKEAIHAILEHTHLHETRMAIEGQPAPWDKQTVTIAIHFRCTDRDAAREHVASRVSPVPELFTDLLEEAIVNPSVMPREAGYEIARSDVTELADGRYRMILVAHVVDDAAFAAEAVEEYARCWGSPPDHDLTIEEKLYEIAVASNANPSPSDIGIELIDWQGLYWVTPEQKKRQEAGPISHHERKLPPGDLLYTLGQRFTFEPGQRVIANGYPGAVARMYTEGMVEVRLAAGLVCIPASYPDCYPSDGSTPANLTKVPRVESASVAPDL
ncbi:hypothetical protein [Burkholderia sp. Tr-20390]|uniref:hypothetical protein n=1 Tax=Burkholderia sp. Tr-20390 TaxID=2703904 RepID=UPI0019818E00|nr:hypothetical protein [Burkholderia sp. Tr-20390]